MPEKYLFGRRRPPFPLWNKNLRVVIGEPIEFDVPMMVETAVSASRHATAPIQEEKWPLLSSAGEDLDEAAQRCLYTALSEKIQSSLETLRLLAKQL